MANRWPNRKRKRRRAQNKRATEALASTLTYSTRPNPNGCMAEYPSYCGGEVVAECSLCHIPICIEHLVDELDEVLCNSCWNGYLQQAGSWGYVSEEKI